MIYHSTFNMILPLHIQYDLPLHIQYDLPLHIQYDFTTPHSI